MQVRKTKRLKKIKEITKTANCLPKVCAWSFIEDVCFREGASFQELHIPASSSLLGAFDFIPASGTSSQWWATLQDLFPKAFSQDVPFDFFLTGCLSQRGSQDNLGNSPVEVCTACLSLNLWHTLSPPCRSVYHLVLVSHDWEVNSPCVWSTRYHVILVFQQLGNPNKCKEKFKVNTILSNLHLGFKDKM
jgi:hypothetical protein